MSERVCSVLEIDRINTVLHRRCESQGVSLQWSRTAPTAMTDGKNKVIIPILHSPITQDAMDKLYGYVVHECGHHARPEAFKILGSAQPNEALQAIYNIMEDDGMERQVANEYAGDALALGQGNAVTIREITDNWQEQIDGWPKDVTEQQIAPVAICALGQLSRLKWDVQSNVERTDFFKKLHPVAKKLLDRLAKDGWVDKMQATENEHDTWDLACDLYKELFPDEDDDKLDDMRAKGHAMEPAGEPTACDRAEQSEDGTKVGEEKKTEVDPEAKEGTVISWKDAVLSEHDNWEAKKPGQQAGNIGIDWTDYNQGSVVLMPQHMINVIDCRGAKQTVETYDGRRGVGTPESFRCDNSTSRQFANQIRRYLQSLERTRISPEKYHGKLDKRSLVKLALPPIDGGEWNKKLFFQLTRREGFNTSVHILTDWSGSMHGQKMVHAADASARLVYVFDRILKMPVQLAAFTNAQTKCDIGLLKGFNDRSIGPHQIAENFSKFFKYSSANNDADAVLWAYNQLKKRKETRRILIVLSDGCPAGAWGGNGSENLKHVTRMIEKEGKIELYGVGIKSNAVETYYQNCRVLDDESEINRALFEVIRGGV